MFNEACRSFSNGTVKTATVPNRKGGVKEKAFNVIAKFEGFETCAYQDLGGGYSIGYGTHSHIGECITKEEAKKRVLKSIDYCNNLVTKELGEIPINHKVALIDVCYNVRPVNYDYIFNQYRIKGKVKMKKELTYALSRMQYSNNIKYDGLVNRFDNRIDLLFNN